jgi:hypothetical protein
VWHASAPSRKQMVESASRSTRAWAMGDDWMNLFFFSLLLVFVTRFRVVRLLAGKKMKLVDHMRNYLTHRASENQIEPALSQVESELLAREVCTHIPRHRN